MPKRTDIKKVMVIGSGPIVIGQAAEFDYAGTQACLALKEEGYEVILVNSNPATIMTDTHIADKVYMEPLKLEYVAKIIRYERPDAIVPGLGGQTGLNLAVQLARKGILEECQVEILGTSFESIEQAEDRELFKELCIRLGEPVLPSEMVGSVEEAIRVANEITYPVVLRPAFTLGGTGGGFADNESELRELMHNALMLSPVHQVLVEKSIKGYKEIEYEVMRDRNDTAITICNMENVDPVGIHTGDSIVVAPSQTLTNKEYQLLRDSALKIIRALRIEGGCNVQFALDPLSFNYYIIEVNPRVSRSSALASKASGYPIARVSAKIAVGLTLDEIDIANTPASFEPALDYVVTKIPRFPFDKFSEASNELGTQMKATGEVMSVGRTIEESLLKAVRSLETGVCHLYSKKFDTMSNADMLAYIARCPDDRLYAIAQLIRNGIDLSLIYDRTKIDMFFLEKIKNIVEEEAVVAAHPHDRETLYEAKRMGFSDKYIGKLWGCSADDVFAMRERERMFPVYKMIDTCASEFQSYVPYFYSTYEQENESVVSDRRKIVVLGSGPIRIGQGVEFDYSTVHAIWAIREAGYEAIIINNNPETVSTDYTISDKLYFEPLTVEDVMNVIRLENPLGVVVSLGGQTAINLAEPLARHGVKIIGTGIDAINKAEDRKLFENIMNEVGIPQPPAEAITDIEEGVRAAERIGYPVLVRPSFVLGGRAMQIVGNEQTLRYYLHNAVEINENSPVLVDKYIMGKELEVDAICDGRDVFIPGIMEHVEKTGIHSGDSISVYPTFSVSEKVKRTITDYTKARPCDRHRRTLQHTVHRRRRREGLRHRGQPALVAHGAVPIEIDRGADGADCHARHPRPFAARAGHHGGLRTGAQAVVRQDPGLLLRQDQGRGLLPLPGDEVDGRGHRLRRHAHARTLQVAAGIGNGGRELRHHTRDARRQGQADGAAAHKALLQPRIQHRGHARHGQLPARARPAHPLSGQAERGQQRHLHDPAQGTRQLCGEHHRPQPAQHASGRLRDTPCGR